MDYDGNSTLYHLNCGICGRTFWSHDAFESVCDDCKYTDTPILEHEAVKPQDAEMLVIHNGGAEEYVKDIESIVLLAHKDYDIVYCGKFSEGSVN